MHDMDEEEYQNKFYQNDNDDNTDNNKRINIKYFFIDINQFFYETDVTFPDEWNGENLLLNFIAMIKNLLN